MTQARLNHLMVLHVHRVETDALDIHAIARDFVSGHMKIVLHSLDDTNAISF